MSVKKFFGSILIFIGFNLMMLAGGCTLFIAIANIRDIVPILAIGGVPTLIGFVLFKFGHYLHGDPKDY